jgi:hypothetical protein
MPARGAAADHAARANPEITVAPLRDDLDRLEVQQMA